MNEKEAQLIGMHVGDGTLYQTNSKSLVWELRGSVDEKDFYSYVAQMIKELFNIEVKPKYRGPNSYGIQTTNKIITKFLVENGFKPGSKVYTVSIPDDIKKGDIEIRRAFIRGLFDTDGCIFFDKNRTEFHYYPRLEFGFASKPLAEDLFDLLNEIGFRVHRWQSKRKEGMEFKVALAGFKNLDKWMREIKPVNSKHLIRIERGLLNKDKINLKSVSKNV